MHTDKRQKIRIDRKRSAAAGWCRAALVIRARESRLVSVSELCG